MYSVSPELTTAASPGRTRQLHVRKLRLESREADAWQPSTRNTLAVGTRRRFWTVAGVAIAGSALLAWGTWELWT